MKAYISTKKGKGKLFEYGAYVSVKKAFKRTFAKAARQAAKRDLIQYN